MSLVICTLTLSGCTVDSHLFKPHDLSTLIIRMPKVTVLLEYFVISVHCIRVIDCSIRVIEHSSVMASVIRTIVTYLMTNYKNKSVQITEDYSTCDMFVTLYFWQKNLKLYEPVLKVEILNNTLNAIDNNVDLT